MEILNLCFTHENRAKGVWRQHGVDSVGSVDNTPSYIANYSRRQSDFAFTRWQFAQFFCVHTFCLQARRRDWKFKNPSWNRAEIATKRWLGRIPTVPLCPDRPGMCPPKTWCQQLESSLHKENLKPWPWHEYIISYIFQ